MNKKGMGLIGLLLAVVIVAVLTAAVLKQYARQTQKVLNTPGLQSVAPAKKQKGQVSANAPKCNGRLVGNICVPTEVRSSSLDAFNEMNK
ncbi:MAG TPA: hypothetical protein DCP52_05110 [Elusimicrobia bacterium]|nr:hypothetical protein [Elusimicrobiota bacterium]